MPARNAQSLVDFARQQVGIFDNTRLRDGFADDLGEADFDILSHLNAYYRSQIPAGFVKCWFQRSLTQNVATYTFDSAIGSITTVLYFDATISGVPIEKTQITSLLSDAYPYDYGFSNPLYGPLNQPTAGVWAFPRKWYADPPRTFNLWPPPTASGAYVRLLAESEPSDLVLTTDIPIDLFNGLHDELAFGAAAALCNAMATGADAQTLLAKVPYLLSRAAKLETHLQDLAQHRGENEHRQVRPNVWVRGRR